MAKNNMSNQIDPIDIEVNGLLEMAKSKKFKSGIYNFCDRWCERCKDTEKCFLYAQEKQRRVRNMVENKDNNDWLAEVKHNFEITQRLIERSLKEEGIDPQKVLEEKPKKYWDDNAEKCYDKVQCLIKAREYMKEVANFLNDFHKSRLQHYSELGMEISFDDIKDEIDIISWYHTFLLTKIWRTLYEKECCRREKDKYLKNLTKKDFKKFCLLVMRCINKSIKAWRNLTKKRKEFSESAKKFLAFLTNIKDAFKKEIGTEKWLEKKKIKSKINKNKKWKKRG